MQSAEAERQLKDFESLELDYNLLPLTTCKRTILYAQKSIIPNHLLNRFESFRRQESAAHVLDSLDPNTSDPFPFQYLGSISFLIRVRNDTHCRATCSVLI